MARLLRAAGGLALRFAAPCGALLAALALPSACTSAAAAVQPGGHPLAAPVAEAAQRFGIPERWIWRVMHTESRGRAGAVSHAGAMGLMQIMPATWASLTARHGLGSNPFDPRANILAGAAYLRAMWDRYGDIRLMLAAYNAGPGRADAFAAGRRGLPAETVAYVSKITSGLSLRERVSPATGTAIPAPPWRSASLFPTRSGSPRRRDEDAAIVEREVPNNGLHGETGRVDSLFVPLSAEDRQ
ncbi:lytic transglycosylase domain-containing protein [Sphingopyxis sp. 550A]